VGFQKILHPLEGWAVEDRLMFSLEPFSVVMHLADVNAVLEKVGEGTISERNAALVSYNFCVPPLGDDFPAIEFSYDRISLRGIQDESSAGRSGTCSPRGAARNWALKSPSHLCVVGLNRKVQSWTQPAA
jgi:hypothetical protein